MNSEGALVVCAENGVEAFALQCWADKFLAHPTEVLAQKIIVSWGVEASLTIAELTEFPPRQP